MVEIQDWTKKHRSALAGWPSEVNPLLPAFLLRSVEEPYDTYSASFAIVEDDALVGRFTYRLIKKSAAFVGLVLSPGVRGRGLAASALIGSILRLGQLGITSLSCSIACANIPSMRAFSRAGFMSAMYDYRQLPIGFDLSLLWQCDSSTYVLVPVPAMLYVSMSASTYTEVAQR